MRTLVERYCEKHDVHYTAVMGMQGSCVFCQAQPDEPAELIDEWLQPGEPVGGDPVTGGDDAEV